MKLLFAHDHKFHRFKHEFYSNGSFSKEVLRRYINIFKQVRFVSRQVSVNDKPENMSLASMTGISFVNVADFLSLRTYYKKKSAKRVIENEVKNADCIIARLPSTIGSIAVGYAEIHRKPYLIEVVACPWDALWNHSFKGKIAAPFMYLKTKKQVGNADNVLYVTNNFLQSRYPSKGKSIGCSDVSLPSLGKSILERRIEKIKRMNSDTPFILGTIAAIDVRYKGQEYVIEAISKLNRKGLDFEYHLVGGGDESYLKSIAEKHGVADKIKFLGSMSHNMIFDYLDNIDLYIQPSKVEGLPRALVEAMSRGCPALGSAIGGIPELINDECLFNRGSVKGVSDLLAKIDKDLLLREAKGNFKRAMEYDEKLLDRKRNDFYLEFRKGIV